MERDEEFLYIGTPYIIVNREITVYQTRREYLLSSPFYISDKVVTNMNKYFI